MKGETKMDEPRTRSVEVELEIAAPVEAVWRALTEARGLESWFPLEARVEPGAGGSIWSSWRGAYESSAAIEVWEPNRRLRLVQETPDWLAEGAGGSPPVVAQDFRLEGRGGSTLLRLVHSGFSAGSDWDEMFDGVRRGWNFELRGLRHYLEQHEGQPREVAWSRVEHDLSTDEAWRRLTERVALRAGDVGEEASLAAPDGERWSGELVTLDAPLDLAMVVDGLNRAYLRIRLDRSHVTPGRNEVNVFVSTYGLEPGHTARIEAAWTGLLEGRLR